jgi:hypothetical protein
VAWFAVLAAKRAIVLQISVKPLICEAKPVGAPQSKSAATAALGG